jgi:3-hydroxyisobutyrate dehydrogenase-like beta-hydroxyacid dehydrogenase
VLSGVVGVVAGGPAEALKRCAPLFAAIGRRTFEAGSDPAAATSLKLANNFVLGCAIEAIGEGFALIRKYGVPPEVFYDVMTDGLFAAPAYKVYGKIIVDQSYDRAGQMAKNGLKDAKLALAAGKAMGVPLPSGQVWHDRLAEAVKAGEGEKDWAVMALVQARASGLT